MIVESNEKGLPTVLITGCSAGGMGSALAEAFHERGLHVFATARSLAKMSHLEKLPNVTLLELDVTSSSSIAAAVEKVTAQTGGKLDYLVNNSGKGLVLPALETDLDRARKLFDVNFWGMVQVTHAFMPLIIAAKGTIVNSASLAAVLHVPWGAFYNASKAAVVAYGESLRLEMAPLGVRVLTVITGVVRTKLFENVYKPILPDDSLFKPASKEISATAEGALLNGSMSAEEFAKRVTNDVLGGATRLIWRGKMASFGWFISSFFPSWLIDRSKIAGSGVEHLTPPKQ
ncbi:hypothetical protein VTO42DRAFT_7225 [Malbranchea cinnamomea]